MTKDKIPQREREILIQLICDINLDTTCTIVTCRFCENWSFVGFVNEHVSANTAKHIRDVHKISFEAS